VRGRALQESSFADVNGLRTRKRLQDTFAGPAAHEENGAGSITDDQIDEALKIDARHLMRWWELRLIDSSMAKWTWGHLIR